MDEEVIFLSIKFLENVYTIVAAGRVYCGRCNVICCGLNIRTCIVMASLRVRSLYFNLYDFFWYIGDLAVEGLFCLDFLHFFKVVLF